MEEQQEMVVDESFTPEETQVEEKSFTKEQVNNIMQKRVKKTHQSFFNRYGVKDLQELDDRFAMIEKLQAQIGDYELKNNELSRTNIFLRNSIKPDKYDDVIAICGNDFSEEKLIDLLQTHPEWINKPDYKTSLMKFGKAQGKQEMATERDEIDRLFGK